MNTRANDVASADDALAGIHSQQRMVGRHSWALLINADCLETKLEEKPDAIITDPPYGISLDTN